MSIEEPISPDENGDKRTPEEEERVKGYIRLALFVLILVVVWYGLDLASVA